MRPPSLPGVATGGAQPGAGGARAGELRADATAREHTQPAVAAQVSREPTASGKRPASVTAKVALRESTPAPRRPRLWISLGVLVALAAAGVGAHRFVTRSPHFAFRTLRFAGKLQHVDEESLKARVHAQPGANLFAVDLDEVARDVSQEPWLAHAHARRELPGAIVVDVVEREAACVVALGALYLADADGQVFKRATPEEAAAWPVVTGVEREQYLAEPERARARFREALTVARAWQSDPARPALGELHLDGLLGVTAYTTEGAVGVRLGAVDDSLTARLTRFDAVWAALAADGKRPRLIYLDNRARPDRVTVKLAAPPQKPET